MVADIRFIARARRLATGAALAALAFAAAPLSADVKAGVDAWSAGDYDVAVAEWQGPADEGNADALFNLAQAYRLGRGVEADIARARALYAEAAERGHLKASDNYGLLLFQQGEQDTAMPLIRDAAERGDPRAQYVLGLAHFNGDYAEKDWVRAYALLTLANGSGLPQAATALGQMDQYVPLAQRQQAQSVARELELTAQSQRSAQLAAIDLGSEQPERAGQPQARPRPQPRAQPQPQPRTQPEPAETVRVAAASAPVVQPAARPEPQPQPARAAGPWRVQLGAFAVEGNADRLWSRLAANPALSGTSKKVVRSGKLDLLQAEGFASRTAAQTACNTLKRQGQGCIVAGS